MLEKFVRLFASASLEEKRDMSSKPKNSDKLLWDCLAYMLVCFLLIAFVLGDILAVFDTEWKPESFVLERAEHYHQDRSKGADVDELYLYSADGRKYAVEDNSIYVGEIEAILAKIEPGMQIDVLLAKNGIRELTADGEMLLPREVTAKHVWSEARSSLAFAAIPFFLGIYAVLRAVALYIKKRKGWNF